MIFEGIDLFAGAGGTTSGIERAKANGRKIGYVIAAVNHDPVAIASHAKNHKKTRHFIEDIRTLDVSHLPKLESSDEKRTFLWASLECTNFSNAKGGGPRDADSRTLGEHLYRYIEYLMPDYILIENVKEFLGWGPLVQKIDKKTGLPAFDRNGDPVMVPESRTKGRDFIAWKNKIQSYGYEFDYKLLNAADYGAHTSRERLFIIFAKTGLPIAWPEATHSRTGANGLKKWRPVKEVLDFQDKGKDIFDRKKPLSENTYKRIYSGLVKFVAKGDSSFITKWLGNDPVTGTNPGKSINEPCPVITTQNRLGLVNMNFMAKYHGSGENVFSIEDTCSTITTKDRLALISTEKFMMTYYGGDGHVHSVEDPANAITTKDHHALIQTEFFIEEHYGTAKGKSIEEPSGSLLTVPKQNLVSVDRGWIMNPSYGNTGSSLEGPAPTLLASRRHYYLMNPQYASAGGSIENPCFTLIARMDKKPPYLVEAEPGKYAIEINETDTPYMVKIKQFMAIYGIVAIYMRMLNIPELLRIQGFGDEYILEGNQSDQKKFIGNAVPPKLSKHMIEALHRANTAVEKLRFAI